MKIRATLNTLMLVVALTVTFNVTDAFGQNFKKSSGQRSSTATQQRVKATKFSSPNSTKKPQAAKSVARPKGSTASVSRVKQTTMKTLGNTSSGQSRKVSNPHPGISKANAQRAKSRVGGASNSGSQKKPLIKTYQPKGAITNSQLLNHAGKIPSPKSNNGVTALGSKLKPFVPAPTKPALKPGQKILPQGPGSKLPPFNPNPNPNPNPTPGQQILPNGPGSKLPPFNPNPTPGPTLPGIGSTPMLPKPMLPPVIPNPHNEPEDKSCHVKGLVWAWLLGSILRPAPYCPPVPYCPPAQVCPPVTICSPAPLPGTVISGPVVIEAPVEEEMVPALQLVVGVDNALQATGLGDVSGEVIIELRGITLPVTVTEWKDDRLVLGVPVIGFSEPTQAMLVVFDADQQLVAEVPVELLTPQMAQDMAAGE